MKILTALSSFALVFVIAVSPVVSAGQPAPITPPIVTDPITSIVDDISTAQVAPVPPAAYPEFVPAVTADPAVNTMPYTPVGGNRTASIIGWIIGLGVLAIIIGWAVTSARSRRNINAPTINPADQTTIHTGNTRRV